MFADIMIHRVWNILGRARFRILCKVNAQTTLLGSTIISTTSQEFTTVTPDTSSGAFSRNPLARLDDFGESTTGSVGAQTTSLGTTSSGTLTTGAGLTGTGTSGTTTSETGPTGTVTTSTGWTGLTQTSGTWEFSSTTAESAGTSQSAGDSTDMALSTVSLEMTSTTNSKTTYATSPKVSKQDVTSTTSTISPRSLNLNGFPNLNGFTPRPRNDVLPDDDFNLSATTLSKTDSELETTSYISESTTEVASVLTSTTDKSAESTGPTTAYETSQTSAAQTSQTSAAQTTTDRETTTILTSAGVITTTTTTTTTTDALVDALLEENVEPIPQPPLTDITTPSTSPDTSSTAKNEESSIVTEKSTFKPDVTNPGQSARSVTGDNDVDSVKNRDTDEDREAEFTEVNRKCKFR